MLRWLRYSFKQRITNTKAVVCYETPWYIRAFALLLAFLLGIVAASVFYTLINKDGVREIVDPAMEQALKECQASMRNNAQLNDTIEQAQLIQLSEQIEQLQAEKTQLRADLAVCNKLSTPAGKPGETLIKELTLQQESPGVYRYSLLVSHTPEQQNLAKEPMFEGTLFLSVDLIKNNRTIVVAGQNGILSQAIDLKIKYFERFSGTFKLPVDQKIRLFRARIRKNGRIIDTQTTALNTASPPVGRN